MGKHRKNLWHLLVSDKPRVTFKVKEPASRSSPQLYVRVGLGKFIYSVAVWNFLIHVLSPKLCMWWLYSITTPYSLFHGSLVLQRPLEVTWSNLSLEEEIFSTISFANATRTCLVIKSSCPFKRTFSIMRQLYLSESSSLFWNKICILWVPLWNKRCIVILLFQLSPPPL